MNEKPWEMDLATEKALLKRGLTPKDIALIKKTAIEEDDIAAMSAMDALVGIRNGIWEEEDFERIKKEYELAS